MNTSLDSEQLTLMCWRVPSARSHLRIARGSCCTPWRPPKLEWGTHLPMLLLSLSKVGPCSLRLPADCLGMEEWKKNAGDHRKELPGIQNSCTQTLDTLSQRLFTQIIISVEEFGTVSRFLCHHVRCGWEHTASICVRKIVSSPCNLADGGGLRAPLQL